MPSQRPTGPSNQQPAAQIDMVDPRTLLLDRNLRTTAAAADRDLVASLKAHGVLVPLTAVRTDDGLRVRHGHRRTRAAIDAGLHHVPVLILGADSDDTTEQITRILTQWAENEHRAGLTPTDKIGAVEQLAAFGLTPAAIAKRTRTPRGHIDAALRVATSPAARDGLHQHPLDLTQAATLAEFDDDPAAVTQLLTAAGNGTFDHTAQLLRDDREDRAARDTLTRQLRDAGITVIDPPDPSGPARLLTSLDHDGTPLTPDSHQHCPGHAAYPMRTITPTITDPTTPPYRPVYLCTDPDGHGHTSRFHHTAGRRDTPGTSSPTGRSAAQDRADVTENNRRWRAATTVRRTWLREFLTRRTPPAGADRFLAARLAAADPDLTRALTRHHPLAATLLTTPGSTLDPVQLAALIDTAPEPRARVVLLGLVLAAYEDTYADPHTWRTPTPSARRYLTVLQDWGYNPADIEHRIQPAPTPSSPTAPQDSASDPDRIEADAGEAPHTPSAADTAPPDTTDGDSTEVTAPTAAPAPATDMTGV
jgi:ParB family chromosome partitioning protein